MKTFKLEIEHGCTKLIDSANIPIVIPYKGTLEKNRLKTLADWLHDRSYIILRMTRTELDVLKEGEIVNDYI